MTTLLTSSVSISGGLLIVYLYLQFHFCKCLHNRISLIDDEFIILTSLIYINGILVSAQISGLLTKHDSNPIRSNICLLAGMSDVDTTNV